MQSVSSAFTAESLDRTRKPVQSTQVSWKKDYLSSIGFFTIGVSTIGGNSIIPGPTGLQSAWNRYKFSDESDYVTQLSYERSLRFPVGGVSKSLADVRVDNTSGRFLPDYMGGRSELFTAILPRRPMIINTGFEVNGTDQTIPQWVGVFDKSPKIDVRSKTADFAGVDFVDYLGNKRIDQSAMYTGVTSDYLIERFLIQLGMSTAQYSLDAGRQTINFLLLEQGETFLGVINKLVEAENGQFYQNEEGKLLFENRTHWDNAPYNSVVETIRTADVLEASSPDESHLINVVEVKAKPRAKQVNQLVFALGAAIELQASTTTEFFISFDDPMLSIDVPTFLANTASDRSGSNVTSSVTIQSTDKFAKSVKYVFNNATAATAFITDLTVYGRPAKATEAIFERQELSSSVTAYDEQKLTISNDLIQSRTQAETIANTILLDYAVPQNLLELEVRAKPQRQLGDLVSWQGRQWRIWGVKTKLVPSVGNVQRLKMLQRNALSYFTVGVSTIGGSDIIAP